jgi:hypothetical protein
MSVILLSVVRHAEHCYAECCYAECRYAECRYTEVVMLNVANNHFILSVDMQNVVFLVPRHSAGYYL